MNSKFVLSLTLLILCLLGFGAYFATSNDGSERQETTLLETEDSEESGIFDYAQISDDDLKSRLALEDDEFTTFQSAITEFETIMMKDDLLAQDAISPPKLLEGHAAIKNQTREQYIQTLKDWQPQMKNISDTKRFEVILSSSELVSDSENEKFVFFKTAIDRYHPNFKTQEQTIAPWIAIRDADTWTFANISGFDTQKVITSVYPNIAVHPTIADNMYKPE